MGPPLERTAEVIVSQGDSYGSIMSRSQSDHSEKMIKVEASFYF